jgi:hypothetical protein
MPAKSTTTPSVRKRKFHRRFTTAKKKVLEALGFLYCATPKDIARFIRRRIPTVHDVRSVRATLKYLLENKSPLVLRKLYVTSYLYGLTESGARFDRGRGVEGARKFAVRDFDHEHLLTLAQLSLQEFCDAHACTLNWKRPVVDNHSPVNPDAIATVTAPEGSYVFVIEIERQSFNENHLKKAKRYVSVFGRPEAKELFGAEKFRVIFLVETDLRADTIVRKLRAEYPYRMFWVSTFTRFQDLRNPEFRTPKDEERFPLIPLPSSAVIFEK